MYFNCPELLFLFLKGMTGALAPFNYLVFNILKNKFYKIATCPSYFMIAVVHWKENVLIFNDINGCRSSSNKILSLKLYFII